MLQTLTVLEFLLSSLTKLPTQQWRYLSWKSFLFCLWGLYSCVLHGFIIVKPNRPYMSTHMKLFFTASVYLYPSHIIISYYSEFGYYRLIDSFYDNIIIGNEFSALNLFPIISCILFLCPFTFTCMCVLDMIHACSVISLCGCTLSCVFWRGVLCSLFLLFFLNFTGIPGPPH